MTTHRIGVQLATLVIVLLCRTPPSTAADSASQTVGELTLAPDIADPYGSPIPGLTLKELAFFNRGKKALAAKWVVFPAINGEWGLGPTFIADACTGCHIQNGRGIVNPSPDALLIHQLVRLSIPGKSQDGSPLPHPNYAGQLQVQGAQFGVETNVVPAEGKAYVDWQTVPFKFPDGTTIDLRQPALRIDDLKFGPLGESTMTSLRNTQALVGLGFLEAVPESTLVALAAEQTERGFNGRVNYVWDYINNKKAVGRFGWKANEPSIPQQIAGAFRGDLGVTSPLFETENCPDVQTMCKQMPPGNNPELIQSDWDAISYFVRASSMPAKRNPDDPAVQHGEKLFTQARCDGCHIPTLTTGDFPPLPALSGLDIHAYTDLLVHDMGERLADGRPDFEAGPRDWRTPPLWGIGLSAKANGSTHLLHDGRARSVEEAILWHGGEAEQSKDHYVALTKEDRNALILFVNSL